MTIGVFTIICRACGKVKPKPKDIAKLLLPICDECAMVTVNGEYLLPSDAKIPT